MCLRESIPNGTVLWLKRYKDWRVTFLTLENVAAEVQVLARVIFLMLYLNDVMTVSRPIPNEYYLLYQSGVHFSLMNQT